MAWIVKPSATTEIETRKSPYLTPAMKKKFKDEIIPRYERSMGALLPILHDVQAKYGYIPHQAMVEVAKLLEITPGDVLDTVSFYEGFHTHPVGKHVISVCQSVACEVCGHQAILDHLRDRLGVEPHETTEDGKFTLLALECLGSCDTGPVALVDETLHENLSIEKIDEIVDGLQ